MIVLPSGIDKLLFTLPLSLEKESEDKQKQWSSIMAQIILLTSDKSASPEDLRPLLKKAADIGLTSINVATSKDLGEAELKKLQQGLMKAFREIGCSVGPHEGASVTQAEPMTIESGDKKENEEPATKDTKTVPVAQPKEDSDSDSSSSDDEEEEVAAKVETKAAAEKDDSDSDSDSSSSDEDEPSKPKAAAKKMDVEEDSDSDSSSDDDSAPPAKVTKKADSDSDSDSSSSSDDEEPKKAAVATPMEVEEDSSDSSSDEEEEKPKKAPVKKKKNQPFRRVRASGKSLESNSWDPSKHGGHGAEAFEKLGRHQGKDFIKAKNKRKRSNRSGFGSIDLAVRSTDLSKRRKLR